MDPTNGVGVDEVDLKAARKAAKAGRKEEARAARALARKEKKQVKSAAKKERKADVKRASKWTGERKEADKLKKKELAANPDTKDKQIKRLYRRADKLETQAAKVLDGAKKARAQAEALAKARQAEKDAAGADDTSSDSDTSSSDESDDEGVPVKKTQDESDSSSDTSSDEESEEGEKPKPTKKNKKSDPMEIDEDEHKDSKRAEKKRKRTEANEPVVEQSDNKKSKKNKSTAKSTDEQAAHGEQWNVQALDGGAQRQAKFLKLLGGGKKGGEGLNTDGGASQSKADIAHMQSSLEKQFNAGMQAKEAGVSRRRGLGA
ncbi:small acidic protein family-domain-containing protein [Microdochium bolleyi]|uniref:Small acidic protein n=1 Tax=Microdochium bolleyi TaxID=196109 RepID=A0A136J7K6_9PEZI|nr:small acidic protein family-domain-containing protein [Microdochium bolleyi]